MMRLHEKLAELDDAQSELLLLRQCASTCRISHLLRTVPLSKAPEAFDAFDASVLSVLSRIAQVPLTAYAQTQAALPLKHGGCGLRKCADIALPALLGSCNMTRKLVSKLLGHDADIASQGVGEEFASGHVAEPTESGNGELFLPNERAAADQWRERFGQPPPPVSQKQLQEVVDWQQVHSFSASLEGRQRSRLLSLLLPGATAWLSASASPQLGLHLPSPVLRTVLRMFLGLRQPGLPACDAFGWNALSQTGSLMIGRHNDVRNAVHRIVRRFDPRARMEVYSPDIDHQDRPGDVFTQALAPSGKASYLDVAIANPCAQSYQPTAQGMQGHAGADLAARKERKRAAVAVRSAGHEFSPVVAEAFGGWLPDAHRVLQTIASRASAHLGEAHGQVLRRLLQNLSVVIMRGSAAMVARAVQVRSNDDEWDEPLPL